jgi:hypothetical protein
MVHASESAIFHIKMFIRSGTFLLYFLFYFIVYLIYLCFNGEMYKPWINWNPVYAEPEIEMRNPFSRTILKSFLQIFVTKRYCGIKENHFYILVNIGKYYVRSEENTDLFRSIRRSRLRFNWCSDFWPYWNVKICLQL